MRSSDLKAEARRIFLTSLQAVDVCAAMERSLRIEGHTLFAANTSYDLATVRQLVIIAIGKAASPMYEAAADVVRLSGWPAAAMVSVVVSPAPPENQFGPMTFFTGSHPMPDATSRKAATHVLETLQRVTCETLVLFLVSGGASAMLELPLDPALSDEDIVRFNQVLVSSGLPIKQINALRKAISATKGGRLAQAAAPAQQCTLILSDVPSGSLQTVGSGPSLPNLVGETNYLELYERSRFMARLPGPVKAFFESGRVPALPDETDPAFARAAWACILSSEDLVASAADVARRAGFQVEIDNSCDNWDSRDAAAYLLARSDRLAKAHTHTCLISVGEVTVTLPEKTGCGGRNQHFALQCALALANKTASRAVLSAGSDGVDGNSPAAGAIADETTCRRALERGIDPVTAETKFDSFSIFDALGDTILTGPTGNNLRDLRLLLS